MINNESITLGMDSNFKICPFFFFFCQKGTLSKNDKEKQCQEERDTPQNPPIASRIIHKRTELKQTKNERMNNRTFFFSPF